MQEVKIKFDFSHGPIWKDRYDVSTGKWSTGITVLDNDRTLAALNDEAEKEYAALYSFDSRGVPNFDEEAFEQKKTTLSSLVKAIILRLDALNDGTFNIVNEEVDRLKV